MVKMSFGRRDVVVSVALALLTVVIYSQVVHHDFVDWDDNAYVYENPQIRGGLTASSIRWALTASHSWNWHPLTWMSHMLDVELAGFQEGVWLHHVTSVLFHLTNTVLLFAVIRLATASRLQEKPVPGEHGAHTKMGHKEGRPKKRAKQKSDAALTIDARQPARVLRLSETASFWAAAWVAAIFAVHPLHVESVAWIAERKDVLSTFFGLLAILAYVLYARRAFSWLAYLPVPILLALGLMSKPMLVTLPLLLLLLDFWPLGRIDIATGAYFAKGWFRRRVVLEKIPLLVLVLASSVVTFVIQREGGAMRSLGEMPIGYRMANPILSYAVYIRQTIWPVDLAFFYPMDIHQRPMFGMQVALSALVLVAITGVSVWQWRRRPYLVVGWLWYLISLVPVIGLVQVGAQRHADRYMYIPQIGLLVMVAWLLAEFATTASRRQWIGAVAAVSVVSCSALTWGQVATWQNSETLALHALAVTKDNSVANCVMGTALQKADRPAAATYFREAIRLNPRDTYANHDLALILLQQNKLDEAFRYFKVAVKLDPSFSRGFGGLAAVEGRRGNVQNALTYARQAAELGPAEFELQMNLAIVLQELGHWKQAARQYEVALKRSPTSDSPNRDLANGYLRLAAVRAHLNQLRAAEQALRKALPLDPRNADVHAQLGLLAFQQQKPRQAVAHCRKALQIDSRQIDALNTLAWLLATQRDPKIRNGKEAVRLMESLCKQLATPSAPVLDTLAATYAAVGRFEEAVATAKRALQATETSGEKELAKGIRDRLKAYDRREAILEG